MKKENLIPVDVTDLFLEHQYLKFDKQNEFLNHNLESLKKLDIEQIKSWLSSQGFGNGTNYTTESVIELVYSYNFDRFDMEDITFDYIFSEIKGACINDDAAKMLSNWMLIVLNQYRNYNNPNVFSLDIKKLRYTNSDAEFRKMIHSWLNNR